MKYIATLGIIALVAVLQGNALPAADLDATSFSKDVANVTNSILANEETPNNMVTMVSKIRAFIQVSHWYGVESGVYRSIYNTLRRLDYIATETPTPERMLDIIAGWQDEFDAQFDELNIQRDVDASDLPSEINKLVDEFINRYVESSVKLFDNMYTQTKNLQLETEKLAAETNTLIDSLVDSVQKCLEIPRTEFKDTYVCREDTRKALPALAHNNAMIEAISRDLRNLPWLKVDGKTSLSELMEQVHKEKRQLLGQIHDIRDKRESDKNQAKPTETSTQSEEEF